VDDEGYHALAERMMELAAEQPGFLGVESARGADGLGITVSYWRDPQSIRQWREHAEHQIAQRLGRDRWYAHFRLRICRVESEYGFEAPVASDSQVATERERVGTAD
jgi:heme-degrading monooxygenase HmoA